MSEKALVAVDRPVQGGHEGADDPAADGEPEVRRVPCEVRHVGCGAHRVRIVDTMGDVYRPVLKGGSIGRCVRLMALVDTGATVTVVPATLPSGILGNDYLQERGGHVRLTFAGVKKAVRCRP